MVQICPPFQTPLERNLWLSLPAHYVAKKLFRNYMNCKAQELKLNGQEMVDLYAVPTWEKDSEAYGRMVRFAKSVVDLKVPLESKTQEFDLFAMSGGGTLGTFAIHFSGVMKYLAPDDKAMAMPQGKNIVLEGTFSYSDRWDFDPKAPGARGGGETAEASTRIANKFMSGRAFDVTSELVKGRIDAVVNEMGPDITIGGKIPRISIDGVKPSQNTGPVYSPLAEKLAQIVRESQAEDFSLIDILRILKSTCERDKDPDVKSTCPDNRNQN